MEQIEITLNIHEDNDQNGYNITGTITGAGETTEINRHFNGGNAIHPMYVGLRTELMTLEDCEVTVFTNSIQFRDELSNLEDATGTLAGNLRRTARNNDVIIKVGVS